MFCVDFSTRKKRRPGGTGKLIQSARAVQRSSFAKERKFLLRMTTNSRWSDEEEVGKLLYLALLIAWRCADNFGAREQSFRICSHFVFAVLSLFYCFELLFVGRKVLAALSPSFVGTSVRWHVLFLNELLRCPTIDSITFLKLSCCPISRNKFSTIRELLPFGRGCWSPKNTMRKQLTKRSKIQNKMFIKLCKRPVKLSESDVNDLFSVCLSYPSLISGNHFLIYRSMRVKRITVETLIFHYWGPPPVRGTRFRAFLVAWVR